MKWNSRITLVAMLTLALALTACSETVARPQPNIAAFPVFSNPTNITNPFYPVSSNAQAISLGTEAGAAFRTEVTLLPDIKTITWAGGTTKTRVVQYVAYANGKLIETALDYFAQADDGSLYYFGEEVTNYKDGQVANHNGTWIAGKDGAPPGIIMPGQPKVGMVFNPENLPGVVYETDVVQSLSEKTLTPKGPINDGLLIQETLMDGSIEYKVYAAGIGIVEQRSSDSHVYVVVLNRVDAPAGAVPVPLQTLLAQAKDIVDIVPSGDWAKVSADTGAIATAWATYQPQATKDGAPKAMQEAASSALTRLQTASGAKNASGTMQAANDLGAAVIDLFNVYHPAVPADIGRLVVLERQVVLDMATSNFTAAADSLAKANAVWVRVKPSVLAHNGANAAAQFDVSLSAQTAARGARDATALTNAAKNGLAIVAGLEKVY